MVNEICGLKPLFESKLTSVEDIGEFGYSSLGTDIAVIRSDTSLGLYLRKSYGTASDFRGLRLAKFFYCK